MKLAFDVYEPKYKEDTLNPIVLLHSILETKSTWKPIAQLLANRTKRKVYAYDARHHGDSPWSGEYTIDTLVSDLDEFLREHSINKVILIGHSLGGKVVTTFTLTYPERVESLVLEDVPVRNFYHRLTNMAPILIESVRGLAEELKKIRDREKAEQRVREIAKQLSSIAVATSEIIDSYKFDWSPAKWNGNYYEIGINFDVVADSLHHNRLQRDLSGKFSGAALFIFGGVSTVKVYRDTTIEEFFPKASKVAIKDAGHFIHHTFPREYLAEVVIFIEKNKATRSKF